MYCCMVCTGVRYVLLYVMYCCMVCTAVCYVLLTEYYSGARIKKNEMSGACSKYGGQESCIQGLSGKT